MNEWKTDTEYAVGDIVTLGAEEFICVESHKSAVFFNDFYGVEKRGNVKFWRQMRPNSVPGRYER